MIMVGGAPTFHEKTGSFNYRKHQEISPEEITDFVAT